MIDLQASLPGDALPLLTRPELAYVALKTKRGPHVTPELFTVWGNRIWIVTARRTLKSRVLDSGDLVGILLRHGNRSLVVQGEVRKLDPLAPFEAVQGLAEAALAPFALASFGYRNMSHLLGLLGDPRSLPHSPDTLRVPIAIRPLRAAVLEGWRVVTKIGRWSPSPSPQAADSDPDEMNLPVRFTRVTDRFVADAVVGWQVDDTALPLPATWDGERSTAQIPSALMRLIAAPDTAPASVTVEAAAGEHIDDKEGVLLRGEATANTEGAVTTATFDVARATRWDGVETETVRATTS